MDATPGSAVQKQTGINSKGHIPVVSVVLPVFNGEKYIASAVESILLQTFRDFECIVLNDASTDNTLQILESFDDERLIIINNEKNLGLVRTLNKGMHLGQGEFIARMDGDDVSHPERFQKQVAYLRDHEDIDICGTRAHVFGGENYVRNVYEHHDDIKVQLLFINHIVHPSLMIRRSKWMEHDTRFNERFIKCEDYALWIELIDEMKFATLPDVLIHYRIHDENFSVPTQSNLDLIRKWNMENYKTMLTKTGISFTDDDLQIHFTIGFLLYPHLSKERFETCINWMMKIVVANNHSHYFAKQSLCNEIIEQTILLYKKTDKSLKVAFKTTGKILRAFSLVHLIRYIPFKLKKTNDHNTNLVLAQNVSHKSLML